MMVRFGSHVPSTACSSHLRQCLPPFLPRLSIPHCWEILTPPQLALVSPLEPSLCFCGKFERVSEVLSLKTWWCGVINLGAPFGQLALHQVPSVVFPTGNLTVQQQLLGDAELSVLPVVGWLLRWLYDCYCSEHLKLNWYGVTVRARFNSDTATNDSSLIWPYF